MFQTGAIVALAIGYVCALFAIAWAGDRMMRSRKKTDGRPFIYALTLGVYCTSWTFFGSVGLASGTGYDFIPVYIGPILMFAVGWPMIVRIVRLSKSQNLTSVADFLAARYGKSPAVAAIVTIVAVVGTLPYIALQLKAVVTSTEVLLGNSPLIPLALPEIGILETAFVVAIALALFAVLFGTRHIDATEHQHGLMLAVAAESLVKLAAFLTVGLFVLYSVFGGVSGFAERARTSLEFQTIFGRGFNGGTWLTVMFLSFVCVILLPRQFHVTVVENHAEREIKRAAWMFPLYLVLINLFVVPIAAAGFLTLPRAFVDADMFVIALPMSLGADMITTLAYVGGLSAATAMVIVESVALSIMICNSLVVPILLRRHSAEANPQQELAGQLLVIRRIAIFAIVLAGYMVHRALGQAQGLAAIGLVSFAAIAQLAPAFFLGLIWRQGTARGAIAGILAGITVWGYTLMLPWVIKAGWLPLSLLEAGPFGIAWLKPQALLLLKFEPLTHGVIWSMAANVGAYFTVSLLRAPEPVERLQAHLFVEGDASRADFPATPVAFRLWRTSITIGDLQTTAARYLGAERAERAFAEYAAALTPNASPKLRLDAEADVQSLRFTERLLTSAIGAASARLVLALLLRRSNVGSQAALRLLDDASEALQYNRDLLQSALDQVRHGLGVFDKDMRLICWNRQFRELLDLPTDLGRVGTPMFIILKHCADRGDFGVGPPEQLVADRMTKLGQGRETFLERTSAGTRILEIRTAAMPQGGIVATYSDITDRVANANALTAANETLERRVAERTAELMQVNDKLAIAKTKADEANLDKTRFLAAASHDLLQPLNAARLYAASLVERTHESGDAQTARNIDASLSSVEEILSALIDLSRMDAGRLEPEMSAVSLAEVFERLRVEFEPMARAQGIELRVVGTSAWVYTDRRLIRRLLQNLVSNALKYTTTGTVLLGIRRRGNSFVIAVIDTGPGIDAIHHKMIFKEFQRLDETVHRQSGLGLGLSIVERIGRVLDADIGVKSKRGDGSTFWVRLPATQAVAHSNAEAVIKRPIGSMSGLVALCIDNEPSVLDGMRTLLSGWGCAVLTAADGASALSLVQSQGVTPDAILADYQLDHETGVDAINHIRTHTEAGIAGIIITANHSPDVQRDIRSRGLAFLGKPVKAANLRALLMQIELRRKAAAE